MITAIIKKDWQLLWPMVFLLFAIQSALAWALFRSGLFAQDLFARELIPALRIAWLAGVCALVASVVQQDAIPGVDQDWLIRPIARSDLLFAKVTFLLTTVVLPQFILDLFLTSAWGLSPGSSLGALIWKEIYLILCLITPLLALASTIRNTTEFAVMGAALLVTYVGSMALGTLVAGERFCPTCDSGFSWLQHGVVHVVIFIGAATIIALQFYRRLTGWSRLLALAGAVIIAFTQLSWDAAFSLQRWFTGSQSDAARVRVDSAAAPQWALGGDGGIAGLRDEARLLLHGDMGDAEKYLRQRGREHEAMSVEAPVQFSGVAANELLLLDRSEAVLLSGYDRVLYRGTDNGNSLNPLLTNYSGQTALSQRFEIPGDAYRAAAFGASLRLTFWLTLMARAQVLQLAAVGGEVKTDEGLRCATKLVDKQVSLRCVKLGALPFCVSAALYASDGSHNPDVVDCTPSYRPYVPSVTSAVGVFGIDLPIQGSSGLPQLSVSTDNLALAHVVLTIYGVQDHFKRALLTQVAPRN